jgi:HlyD family secretion protein
LAGLKLGQEVEVGIDAEGGGLRKYPGNIIHIAEQAEFTPKIIQTREERINMVYALKISVKNDGYLKIGMPGEVYFHQEDQSLTNTEKQ